MKINPPKIYFFRSGSIERGLTQHMLSELTSCLAENKNTNMICLYPLKHMTTITIAMHQATETWYPY